MRILRAEEVRRVLPMREAIETMRGAFAALASGKVQAPPRAHLDAPDAGTTLVMSARINEEMPADSALAVKVVSLFAGNPAIGLARLQAAVVAFDPATGRPTALLEGGALTAIRTGAVAGLATDLLARAHAKCVAVFGAGVQARTQLEAVRAVRPIERVFIYDTTREAAEAMAQEIRAGSRDAIEVQVADTPRDAIGRADIVCTATVAATPVFDDRDVRPGTHIGAIGSYKPHVREIPPETVVRSRVVVDQREAALDEAGDLLLPIRDGLIDTSHIAAELGELVLGRAEGRQTDEEITLFKSVGHAVQDAAAASRALANAKRQGIGSEIEW